ncbi:MAG: DUF4838 domain-containing protein [Clostridia bacterium]|nr:DUF4838 domain-containing protein [Clostridia bacterium]
MKKLISLILCAYMLFSALAIEAFGAQYNPETLDEDNMSLTQNIMRDETYVMGDANGDGGVDGKDSLSVKASVAGVTGYELNIDACDFDADGSCSAKDSYSLKTILSGSKSSKDFENGHQIYSLTIGGVSVSEFALVIPEDAVYDSNLYFATELLYEYIKDSTGVALDIVRESEAGEYGIYLHTLSDDSEEGAALGHEGYTYKVVDGNLHIYGTHRGCMYAAYEIIEDYLGYGFVIASDTFVYKQRSVDIPEGTDRTLIPPYRFRHTKSTFPAGNRESGYLARRLNGAQSYNYKNEKRSVEYYGDFVGPVFNNIHSYAYYWQMGTGTMPADDGTLTLEERYYAKLHSGEVKDETKWEPCATLQKDYDILFEGFLDTIRMIEARGYPIKYQDDTNCYSFSANDNDQWCSCRNCRNAAKTKTYTGVYLELANRGTHDIQEYYPGLEVFTWIYTREMPTNVLPDENLVIVLSGFNCANHHLGSGDCIGNTFFEHNNNVFEDIIDNWDGLCKETGAEIWFWYYPETHFFYLFDIPNIYTIYYDMIWLNEHGVDGMFYEGSGGRGYLFENLKAYLASKLMLDTSITLDEYNELIKDYLYMVYGRGYEYIYEFIMMYEEAGDLCGTETGGDVPYCFIGNYDRAYDFVSITYINENYEEMRDLLLAAIEANDASHTTNAGYRERKLDNLFYCFEILGLGATYLDNYANGTDEERAEYQERFDAFYSYYKSTGMTTSSYTEYDQNRPENIDLDRQNPAYYFFPGGSRRASVVALLGKEAE